MRGGLVITLGERNLNATRERGDCGPICLTLILALSGRSVCLREIKTKMRITEDGVTVLDLVRTAASYGLDPVGVKVKSREAQTLWPPAILHWGEAHFVVLTRWSRGKGLIVNPPLGARYLAGQTINNYFSGVAIVFKERAWLFKARQKSITQIEKLWKKMLQV